MDLLLINPGSFRGQGASEHLGILSLDAYASQQGFNVDVIDMGIENIGVKSASQIILEKNPGVLGITMLDDTKSNGFSLIKLVRRLGYHGKIVLGGYFATFSAYDILSDFPEVDFIVRGEGELTLIELLQVLIRKQKKDFSDIMGLSFRDRTTIIENPSRPLIVDLDILPPVNRKYARTLLDANRPLRVYATRGCWGACTFCDIISLYHHSPGKQWRRRSVKSLVNEIKYLVSSFETNYFIFNDDQFLVKGNKSINYVEEFAREVERQRLSITFDLMCRADTVNRPVMARLQSVGLKRIFLGLESFDEKQLQRYNKGISVRQNLRALRILYSMKIDVIASVILADAYTTLFDLLKQFSVLFRLTRRYFNSKNCQISINKKLEIYRGSRVYQEYKQKNLLIKDDYLHGYDFKLKPLTDLRLKILTLEEKTGQYLFRLINRVASVTRLLF